MHIAFDPYLMLFHILLLSEEISRILPSRERPCGLRTSSLHEFRQINWLGNLPLLCEILGITPNTLFGFPDTKISAEALGLYNAFLKYPEYQSSVMRLLGLVYGDIEMEGDGNDA